MSLLFIRTKSCSDSMRLVKQVNMDKLRTLIEVVDLEDTPISVVQDYALRFRLAGTPVFIGDVRLNDVAEMVDLFNTYTE